MPVFAHQPAGRADQRGLFRLHAMQAGMNDYRTAQAHSVLAHRRNRVAGGVAR